MSLWYLPHDQQLQVCRMHRVEQMKRWCSKHHTSAWLSSSSVQTEMSQSGVPWKLSSLAVDQQRALFGGILPSWVRMVHACIGVGSGICASHKKSSGTLSSPVRSFIEYWNVNSYKVSAFSSPNVRPQTPVYLQVPNLYKIMYTCMYEFYMCLINRQTLNILFNHLIIQ